VCSLSTNKIAPLSSSETVSATVINARTCVERNHSPRLPPASLGRRFSAVQGISGQANSGESQSQVRIGVMTRTCGHPGRLVARVALSGPIGCLAFDGFNETMLTQIVVNWELLHSPACASELDTARGDVIRARQLDILYRKALSLATQSYCQG
jgi:hypothetical protein